MKSMRMRNGLWPSLTQPVLSPVRCYRLHLECLIRKTRQDTLPCILRGTDDAPACFAYIRMPITSDIVNYPLYPIHFPYTSVHIVISKFVAILDISWIPTKSCRNRPYKRRYICTTKFPVSTRRTAHISGITPVINSKWSSRYKMINGSHSLSPSALHRNTKQIKLQTTFMVLAPADAPICTLRLYDQRTKCPLSTVRC